MFYAELNELLTRELAEHGYSGVEVRVTPMRTEIIIKATRTQNVLGEPRCTHPFRPPPTHFSGRRVSASPGPAAARGAQLPEVCGLFSLLQHAAAHSLSR